MSDTFLMQLVGTAAGGFAAWAAIKVEVALAKQIAEAASNSAKEAHERLDVHIDRHHAK